MWCWISLLGLTACGNDAPTNAINTPTNPPAPATVQTTFTPSGSPVPPTPVITLVPQPTVKTPSPTPLPANPTAHQPAQPTSGPGGSEKIYQNLITHEYEQGDKAYYIIEPTSPKPTKPLPLILLLHGYTDISPDKYQPWIEHLVERGNIVIFPVYQTLTVDGSPFISNATEAFQAALERLKDGTHAPVDLTQTVYVGYSAGGVIATDLTVNASKLNLPIPKALLDIAPGGCSNCSLIAIRNFALAQPAELATIPPQTKIVLVAGDRDVVTARTATDIIWQNLAQIPAANKSYLEALSDTHGIPTLIADHGMTIRQPPTALEYNGIWKLLDGLQSCALTGQDCEYALGDTPQQLNLGQWSDGVPVTPFKVLG